jgi:NTE family protein
VGNRLIENMALPLGIVATDLNSGQGVLFQRGDTGTAVRASSAVPSVFQPVKIGARVRGRRAGVASAGALCAPDGGGAGDCGGHFQRARGQPGQRHLQILLQTFAIMGKSINSWELKEADVVVRPALVGWQR